MLLRHECTVKRVKMQLSFCFLTEDQFDQFEMHISIELQRSIQLYGNQMFFGCKLKDQTQVKSQDLLAEELNQMALSQSSNAIKK